jgi:hypothetical protein
MSTRATSIAAAVAGGVGIAVFMLLLGAAPADSPRHWLLGGLVLSVGALVAGVAGTIRELRRTHPTPQADTGLTYGTVARLDHGAGKPDPTNGDTRDSTS